MMAAEDHLSDDQFPRLIYKGMGEVHDEMTPKLRMTVEAARRLHARKFGVDPEGVRVLSVHAVREARGDPAASHMVTVEHRDPANGNAFGNAISMWGVHHENEYVKHVTTT